MTEAEPDAATQAWLERAVIGLNLCPFAKSRHLKQQIRYVLSAATDAEALLAELLRELNFLADADPEQVETTLHLLRESSVERAVASFPDAAGIYERNIETLQRLGHAGWRQLWIDSAEGKTEDTP